jgi:hypothetical protein
MLELTFSQPVSVADAPLKHHATGGAPRPGYDVFGNSVAVASFSEPSAELRIESDLVLEIYTAERPPFEITPEALSYPFIYSADDHIDISRMLGRPVSRSQRSARIVGARLLHLLLPKSGLCTMAK